MESWCGRKSTYYIFLCSVVLKICFCLETDFIPTDNDVMKVITDKCVAEYSLTCFKLDLLTVIERLDAKENFEISSGISLIRKPTDNKKNDFFPRELVINLMKGNFTDDANLDYHLFRKLATFLRSIKFSFPLINDYFLEKSNQIFGINSTPDDAGSVSSRGRRKLRARWLKWLASIAYAVGFGLLAGLVSKSLLLSFLALGLALLTRLFPGNFGFGNAPARNNYEIVAHPMPQIQHMNTHSTEVKYEDDHSHSSSHPGIAYVYPRNMPHIEKILAFHHLANLHKKIYSDSTGDVLAYKGYITETSGK